MNYPQMRLPASHVEKCRQWAQDIIDSRRGGSPSRSISYSKDPDIFLNGRLCEVVVCQYYGLRASEALNWSFQQVDDFDLQLGALKIDVKSSEHAYAELMPYSVVRTDAGLYDGGDFSHLLMVRKVGPDEFELCGWMTKQDFADRHLVAPEGHPKAAGWIPGTWYVPIEWLEPVEQLRCYRGPYVDHAGRFVHWCQHELCGREAGRGFGVDVRQGRLGRWLCPDHVNL